ncbi:carboxylate-amine ligase [Saccharopolyspora montiporae]|uniref:carboxylate-amine ligase n=1 Tax=Saccharopolyspora montiporae TaxID=2781240 RepID=UPI00351BF274
MQRHDGRRPPTFGIEEEFLLLDPETCAPADRAVEVLAGAGRGRGTLTQECTRFQVEAATPVCRGAEDAGAEIASARRALGGSAERHGLRLAATGFAPLGVPAPVPVSTKPRYQAIATRFGRLLHAHTAAGCHVHVGMPDLATAVAVSDQLRPHLPALLALTANSPFCRGRDTGHASWRHVVWSRLPSAGPPPRHGSVRSYERAVQVLLNSGAALDTGMVYWCARPSHRLSTLEVRVADTAGTPQEALLTALLVRGLADGALGRVATGQPAPELPDQVLRAALWRAARDGLRGSGLHPATGELVPARRLLDETVAAALPALEHSGDASTALALLEAVLRRGTGADRQRAMFARRGRMADVLHLLAEQTRDGLPS